MISFSKLNKRYQQTCLNLVINNMPKNTTNTYNLIHSHQKNSQPKHAALSANSN